MYENTLARLNHAPVMAILRGLVPNRAKQVGGILVAAGFKAIEVPLNRDGAYESISILHRYFGDEIAIGAGTVLTPEHVLKAKEVGTRYIVSPNVNPDVITKTKVCDLVSLPGIYTPSEAFTALSAGADFLKLFPFGEGSLTHLSAVKSVLSSDVKIYCVGGVSPKAYAGIKSAGAFGVGLGSALFRPEYDNTELLARATVCISY